MPDPLQRAPWQVSPPTIAEIAPYLCRYWRDPDFAAALDAETEANRAAIHAARQKVVQAEREAVWARYPELNQ